MRSSLGYFTQEENKALLILGLFAFVIRLLLAWQPVEQLLVYTVSDDMYYYLTMAKRFVAGEGITFDGLSKTNGFHPLYFLLCSLVLKLGLAKELTTHILLTLSSGFGVVTAYLIYRIVQHVIRNKLLGFLAFALYAFNPYVIALDLNGMETALYGLLLTSSVYLYLRLRIARSEKLWGWILLGGAIGMTFLARTEGIFFPLVVLLDGVWRVFRRAISPLHLIRYGLMLLAALAVTSPWLLWNLINFGTIEQDSGKIFPFIAQLYFERMYGYQATAVDYLKEIIRNSAWNVYILGNMVLGIPYTVPKRYIIFFLFIPVFVLGFMSGRFPWAWQKVKKHWSLFGFGILYAVLMFCYYSVHHRASFWRYFYAMIIVLIPAFCMWLSGFDWKMKKRTAVAAVIGVVLYLSLSTYALIVKQTQHPQQTVMYQAAVWMQKNLPADTRVGAFNAGIYGFWSDQRIVNLDGVANNDILSNMKKKTLGTYFQKQGITYLCEFEGSLEVYFDFFVDNYKFSELEIVQTFIDPKNPTNKVIVAKLPERSPAIEKPTELPVQESTR
jgi:Dolichyl-phosphate-mannose-protein mannosyltransferase